MATLRDEIKEFKQHCKDNNLTNLLIRDNKGKIIQDFQWYRWLLCEAGFYFGGDIYNIDLMSRYDVFEMCSLFGEDRVMGYCLDNGLDFGEMCEGFGCVGDRYDGVKVRIGWLRDMYGDLLRGIRVGGELVVRLRDVSFLVGGERRLVFEVRYVCGGYERFDSVELSVDDRYDVVGCDKVCEVGFVRGVIERYLYGMRFWREVVGFDRLCVVEGCLYKLLGRFKVCGLVGGEVRCGVFD